jgi:hypothetical protein
MQPGLDEQKAILSKCLSLIQKTTASLRQVDRWQFPTDASDVARDLLLRALSALADPINLEQMDPAVLYNCLFRLRELARLVETSSTGSISWPLVSYCDEIWQRLFRTQRPRIFYSLTEEYNYLISPFSGLLSSYLQGLLPKSRIEALVGGQEFYCLQLAAAEDGNLPLYAVIGHEFGHAMFDHRENEILQILARQLDAGLSAIPADLRRKELAQADRRLTQTWLVLRSIAEELFCDLIGSLLMGPAFFLSLYEIHWGKSNRGMWNGDLHHIEQLIRAHPGTLFRMHCAKRWTQLDSFCSKLATAQVGSASLSPEGLAESLNRLKTLPVAHDGDRVFLHPESDQDADAIAGVLNAHLASLKQSLEEFLTECASCLQEWFPGFAPAVKPSEVAALLERLQHDILPNIVADGSLLGVCPQFTSILNASALYRLHLLATGNHADAAEQSGRAGIVERLTAKAFEVTFMQRKYREWSKETSHGDPQ